MPMAGDNQLTAQEQQYLKARHCRTKDKRDRLKAVYLLGWSAEDVAQALLLDSDTVRSYRYQTGGIEQLLRFEVGGSQARLSMRTTVETPFG